MLPFAKLGCIRRLTLLVTVLLAPATAMAENPSCQANAIRLVVPWAAGGATDVMARFVAAPLGHRLKQTIVVENKPGAGGTIGTAQFVRERPNGCVLLLATSSTNAAAPHLYLAPGFNPLEDFTPVGFIAAIPSVLVVAANSPYRSLADLMAAAQSKPGKLTYGSGGNGSSQHLAGAMLQNLARINIVHVPYRSSAPAVADMIGGHVDMVLDTGSLQHIRAGSVRALAVASNRRLPVLPDVPTFSEAGLPGITLTFWGALFGPRDLPPALTRQLNTALAEVMRDPQVVAQIRDMGGETRQDTPAQLNEFLRQEIGRYAEVISLAGVQPE